MRLQEILFVNIVFQHFEILIIIAIDILVKIVIKRFESMFKFMLAEMLKKGV